ncbi:MAG: GntR family transcriptional regulator [Minwuiales bacterium]|nr:GntR family transcriptional regulator [Minwuiales bacterium]
MQGGDSIAVGSGLAKQAEVTPEDVVRSLEFDILFGGLRPRERLVEDALIRRFGAKRHVVRHALAELERMGIVVRVPNRGATVRDFTAEEVEEIAEVRETLQRQAAQRMPLPAAPELIAALEAAQRRHDTAVASRDPRKIDDANEAFHNAFFEACGNHHLSEAIAHYAYLSRAMRLYPMVDPPLLETLRSEHWAMIDALRTGDRAVLRRLVVDHIQHSKEIYLAVRRSLDRPAERGRR